MQFSVTEYYMIEQIINEFKLVNSKEEVDYSLFIEGN